jgi:ADP-heptose:LPS heptosyltransferase
MLAMDSGNAHMAAMMGVNVITLWGVTHPYAGFAPFNQPLENCLLSDRNKYPKIPTSIYGNRYPESYENAMASIPVEEVLSATKKAI